MSSSAMAMLMPGSKPRLAIARASVCQAAVNRPSLASLTRRKSRARRKRKPSGPRSDAPITICVMRSALAGARGLPAGNQSQS